jgi:hypothetical protein
LKRLLLLPFVCAAVAAVGMALSDDAAPRYYQVLLILAALSTALSAFATTSRFAPGDNLFLSWLFVGIGYSFSTIRYSIRLIALLTGTTLLPSVVLNTMLVLQNLAIVIALLMFVRAWSASGLTAMVTPGARVAWIVIGIAVALVVGGYPLIEGFQTRGASAVLLISTLGDVVGIALIVPLALSAFALRGGLLMTVWLALALSEFFWMLYDIWVAVRAHLAGPRIGTGIEQMIRIAAIVFAFTATVAQRRAAPR